MKAAALLLSVVISATAFAGQAESPHRMTKPDGEVDAEKCAACHAADLSLSRSKGETCTRCHAATLHSGAAEHLGAGAAGVARVFAAQKNQNPTLPLTDDGRIYCGTCHLFHDPAVSQEQPLAAPHLPAATGLPQAVRRARMAQWEAIARTYDAATSGVAFAAKATGALRLPVADGSLCRHCHGAMP